MPSAAARRLYEDQIPPFMSVYDVDAETKPNQEDIALLEQKLMGFEPLHPGHSTRPAKLLPDASHRHNESTSTQNTESADSSPTTTLSTADSASVSDPSPSSSPDSPIHRIPISSFSSAAPFSSLNGSIAVPPPSLLPPTPTYTDTVERPVTSPSPRKPRNMKGLSIQPVSLNNPLASEPSSPSFIKPKIPAMKRKPSQLSLKTNSSDLNLRQSSQLDVPRSPDPAPILQRRALKHSTSSPHMLSGLKSATFGPAGGMSFPPVLQRNDTGLSTVLRPSTRRSGLGSFDSTIIEEESPIKAQVVHRAALDFEPFRESENEDQKSPGYPNGPICIYDPNVYLYLEPTADEALKFDVVINVAREVSNPFRTSAGPAGHSPTQDNMSNPTATIDSESFKVELSAETGVDSPTTPKAGAKGSLQKPEYIHVPWDHNTDIQADLMQLCEIIERRSKDGKKVLVHCQQGASRSASLIIAYGIYQNPELTVNDAYHAAQTRSKWISPNMRLMYCLQDFQKEVSKKRISPGITYKTRSGRSPMRHHRLTLSADNIETSPKIPLTAPLPNHDEGAAEPNDMDGKSRIGRPRGQGTLNKTEPVSPGPSSAPSSFSWADREDERGFERYARFNFAPHRPTETDTPSRDGPWKDTSRGFWSMPEPTEESFNPCSSTGFAPLQLNLPPSSPGFCSFDDILKPPPSPGRNGHRQDAPSIQSCFSIGVEKEGSASQRVTTFPNRQGVNSPQTELRHIPAKISTRPVRQTAVHTSLQPVDLPLRERHIPVAREQLEESVVMSPRVETMTCNPLHGNSTDGGGGFPGMQFADVSTTSNDIVFSPRQTMFPRNPLYPFGRPIQRADPRSPPTKGETPIVRSIDEML